MSQNAAEHGLVYGKGIKVPAAHPYPKISIVAPGTDDDDAEDSVRLKIDLYFNCESCNNQNVYLLSTPLKTSIPITENVESIQF